MQAEETLTIYAIAPWQLKHYVLLGRPQTVATASRRLAAQIRDVEVLQGMDEPIALNSARSLMVPAILQIVGAAATTAQGLGKKCKTLAGLLDSLEPAWLLGPMVAAALKADARRIGLTIEKEAELTAPVAARLAVAFSSKPMP